MKKLLVLVFAFMIACSEDDAIYSIDPLLQSYVDSFHVEAEARGLFFPKENLIVRLEKNISKDGTIHGQSIRELHGNRQRTILIDEAYFYEHQDELSCIESVVFHEFGHALLNRDHNNTFSLMNTTVTGGCYFHDFPGTRKTLIDELFSN